LNVLNDKNVTLGQLQAFAERADQRLDALEEAVPRSLPLALEPSRWTAAEDGWQLTLPLGVTAAHRADAVLDAASLTPAASARLLPVVETTEGAAVFRARRRPDSPLTGTIFVTKPTETDIEKEGI